MIPVLEFLKKNTEFFRIHLFITQLRVSSVNKSKCDMIPRAPFTNKV